MQKWIWLPCKGTCVNSAKIHIEGDTHTSFDFYSAFISERANNEIDIASAFEALSTVKWLKLSSLRHHMIFVSFLLIGSVSQVFSERSAKITDCFGGLLHFLFYIFSLSFLLQCIAQSLLCNGFLKIRVAEGKLYQIKALDRCEHH